MPVQTRTTAAQSGTISADWQVIVGLDGDHALIVADATTGNVLARRMAAVPRLQDIAVSRDDQPFRSQRIAWIGTSGELWVWRWSDGQEVSLTPGVKTRQIAFDHTARQVALVSDGRAGGGNSIQVWNIDKGHRSDFTYNAAVASAEFDPTSEFLLMSSDDRTVQLWNIAAKVPVAQFSHDADVSKAVVSPDGRYVLSAGGRSDATARLWFWRPDDLVAETCSRLSRSALTTEEWDKYIAVAERGPTC